MIKKEISDKEWLDKFVQNLKKLEVKTDRYEKALKEIIKQYNDTIQPEHEFSVCETIAIEALEEKQNE